MAHLYRNGTKYHVQLYVHGRRRRFSLKTDNYGIARDKVRKLEAELISGDLERPTRTSPSELAGRFARHLRAQARPGASWGQTDIYRLREFLGPVCPELEDNPRVRRGSLLVNKPAGGRKSRKKPPRRYQFSIRVNFVEEITTLMISDFLLRLTESRGLAPKTSNEYREIIHRFFNWAIKTQGIRMLRSPTTNPCEIVPKLSAPDPIIRFLSLEQIEVQLASLAPTPQLQTIVAVYIYAGLRREEALWLTHDDVDLVRRVIQVRGKTVNGETWWPKTKRNRAVPISTMLARYLAAYTPPKEGRWYFTSSRGQRWDSNNFSHKLAAVNARHGLDCPNVQLRPVGRKPR
jgi:integrase